MPHNAFFPLRSLRLRALHIAGLLIIACLATTLISNAQAQPVTSDSRIKTFVYNANEVYTITTHYGYQSNIEFGPKEVIDTISVGDRVAWQIIPAGRRLFIRAMEENAHTNMTIVTNLHAYQFDLRSSAANAVFGSEELTYVVRFFYPGADGNAGAAYVSPPPPPLAMQQATAPAPAISRPTPPPAAPAPVAAAKPKYNYRYTFSGPSDIAPTRIYDDGKTTYFKLPDSQTPNFSILTANGASIDMPSHRTADGLVAVDAVAPRFSLNEVGRQVIVYNEAGGEVN